jgi:hypothetical protein
MAKFLTTLKVEQLESESHEGRGTWKLLEPLVYESDLLKTTLTIPAGFVTDFATIPRGIGAFDLLGARANLAATVHDYLYDNPEVVNHVRETADSVLHEAAIAQDCPDWVADALYDGVRVGGWAYWG